VTDVPATGYIAYPLEQDTSTLAEAAFDYIRAEIPGWEPSAGNLETILIEALAQQASELAEVASTVPDAIFRYFGQSLLQVAQKDAVAASAYATWVMVDTDGYTVPAGTQVALGDVAFETVDEFTVAGGGTTQTLVEMVAIEPGEGGNGLTGAATLVDPLAYVDTVTFTTTTSGGVDAESDDEYLDRLSDVLKTLAPRPILPADFALLAQQIDGVYRAVAIDLLDPVTPDTNAARSVTVSCVDEDGEGVSGTIKSKVDAALQAAREVNFDVYVIDPTYTTIDVTVDFKPVTGYLTSDVEDAVEAALEDYLSPANWGLTPGAESPDWQNVDKIRYYEVASVIDRVTGVDYIDYLAIEGNPYGSDISLSGYAALPRAGTIVATAV